MLLLFNVKNTKAPKELHSIPKTNSPWLNSWQTTYIKEMSVSRDRDLPTSHREIPSLPDVTHDCSNFNSTFRDISSLESARRFLISGRRRPDTADDGTIHRISVFDMRVNTQVTRRIISFPGATPSKGT